MAGSIYRQTTIATSILSLDSPGQLAQPRAGSPSWPPPSPSRKPCDSRSQCTPTPYMVGQMAQPTNGNSISPSIKHASIIICHPRTHLQTSIMISMRTAYLTREWTTGIKYSHLEMLMAGMTALILGLCRSGKIHSTLPSAHQLIRGATLKNLHLTTISSGSMLIIISIRQLRERTCP